MVRQSGDLAIWQSEVPSCRVLSRCAQVPGCYPILATLAHQSAWGGCRWYRRFKDFLGSGPAHLGSARQGAQLYVEGVRGHDAFYCPTCQPNRPEARLGRRQLVDWSRCNRHHR